MSRAAQLAGGGAVLCAVATAFATPELYVPGISLLLVAVVAVAWVRWAAAGVGVRLRAPVPGARVQEGDRVALELQVARGRWPLPGATLELGAPGHTLALAPRRQGGVTTTSIAVHRRGRHRFGPARLLVRDPLGVCSREIASEACEVLVLPRLHPMSAVATGGLDRELMSARARAPRGAGEIDGLRPYRPGAPAARIHWPTVARTGELIEHRLTANADERPLVVLDAREPHSGDALDRAVRAAASLCVHLARHGGCGLLLPGDRRSIWIQPDLRAWPAQHARLALVAEAGPPPAQGPLRQAGAIVYVTAAAPDVIEVPRGCWRLGPHPLPGLAVAFTVAGCDAQLVPAAVAARSA